MRGANQEFVAYPRPQQTGNTPEQLIELSKGYFGLMWLTVPYLVLPVAALNIAWPRVGQVGPIEFLTIHLSYLLTAAILLGVISYGPFKMVAYGLGKSNRWAAWRAWQTGLLTVILFGFLPPMFGAYRAGMALFKLGVRRNAMWYFRHREVVEIAERLRESMKGPNFAVPTQTLPSDRGV